MLTFERELRFQETVHYTLDFPNNASYYGDLCTEKEIEKQIRGVADSVPPLTAEEEKVLAILRPEALKGLTFTVRAFEKHANITQNSSRNSAAQSKVPQHCQHP